MDHFPIIQALCRSALANPTPAVRKQLLDYCGDWQLDPARYALAPEEDARLQERYAMLQLRLRPELRLAAVCAATPGGT